MFNSASCGSSSGGGAKRPRSNVNSMSRTVQADVTINLQVQDDMPTRRNEIRRNLGDGAVLGTLDNVAQANVQRGDLVFVVDHRSRSARLNMPAEVRNTGFVAFNALPLMNSRTQEEYQRHFRFMGISKILYKYQVERVFFIVLLSKHHQQNRRWINQRMAFRCKREARDPRPTRAATRFFRAILAWLPCHRPMQDSA